MKKKISIAVFIIGLITLIAGGIFLIMDLNNGPKIQDGEYLVKVGRWQREDAPEVIWQFTEIGKGTLTTNNHLNDYNFIWALEGDKIKIETDWLYTLNNEYGYRINQSENILTLIQEDSTEINFRPASSVDTEVGEDN